MISCIDLKKIFELGRVIDTDSSNSYLHIAYKLKLKNYRIISNGELLIKGKDLLVPEYMKEFLRFHNEAIMIANIINDKVLSIVLRSINTKKEFQKVGTNKNMFYGLGMMDKNFKYGDPIILVEGHLDRDAMSQFYPNVLAITTNKLSNSQVKILKYLTNRFILMLDSDSAGQSGIKDTLYKLKEFSIIEFKHEAQMKDCGDLIKLERTNPSEYEWVKLLYQAKVDTYIKEVMRK